MTTIEQKPTETKEQQKKREKAERAVKRGGHGRNLPGWKPSLTEYTDDSPQRRIKPRAVEIKRAERKAKKQKKLSSLHAEGA